MGLRFVLSSQLPERRVESSGRIEGAAVKLNLSRASNADVTDTPASDTRANRPATGVEPWGLVGDGRRAVMGGIVSEEWKRPS